MKLSELLAPAQKDSLLNLKSSLRQHPETVAKENRERLERIARENNLVGILMLMRRPEDGEI